LDDLSVNGVPQWSVLDLLVFMIHMLLCNIVWQHGSSRHCSADEVRLDVAFDQRDITMVRCQKVSVVKQK